MKLSTKLDQSKLLMMMSDIDAQPDWRTVANLACAYYDNDQLPESVKKTLKERGQPETIHNLIAPTIDGVLGMEAKTRVDLLVMADDPDDEYELIAEAINAEFADACRLGRFDKARSDAYASMIKTGVGFVEVYRNPNAFGPKYKIRFIHRDEVFWDWFSQEQDWSDARWVMRKRWCDVDVLINMFPHKKEVITQAISNWDMFAQVDNIEGLTPNLIAAYEEGQSWTREESEWMAPLRDRVRLQIIYYKTIERKLVMTLANGRVIEYNENNPAHVAAVASNQAELVYTQFSRVIENWYAGPFYLGSKECDAPEGRYPIVPFWGYRKDSNGAPYGLIARAIPAQNEVNFRRIKLTYLLQAKRIIMDVDATNMSRQQVRDEVERPDGLIELNPSRRNKNTISEAFQVQQDFNIASQQFSVMQESMKLIQDTMGVYGAFLGQESNASSGIAIANLVEQGATTLAEINDNYSFGAQLLGELLLSYIMKDLKTMRNHKIIINREDRSRKKAVVINEEQYGDEMLSNDVTRMRAHIALAPVQQTAAYKSQLAERMTHLMAQLPPPAQAAVMDLVLDLSDVPNKAEFMERIRQVFNVPKNAEDMTPEEQQAMAAQQQQEQEKFALAMREMNAKVARLESEARRLQALANKEEVLVESQKYSNAKIQAETGLLLQEMEDAALKIDHLKGQMMANLQAQIDAIPL
ncbi:portal protein [Photobacterium damselae subsp. damselae]|uniref:portal protein n=1 Tax=Photobacterium damselae TaxID=38293 RepID=UPI001F2A795A|nr:portal protein [Photobacterium damselae]UKA08864.1 portal protein [Photobacterium damselae subsp. damselae]UKA23933.1 portal protein [Photobacterium damselae subsp. damselae]